VKAGELLVDVLAEEAERPPVPEEEVEQPPAAEEEVEALLLAEIAIEELGLSTRVLGVLTQAGIKTVQDMVNKLEEGREATLSIAGLGEKSLEEIEGSLRARDFLE
jgi:DNA-directed RNA polymerase alpha subunit